MPSVRRFALVCPNYHPRTCGVGDHSMRLAVELQRRGHDAAIFTRQPVAPHPEAPQVRAHGQTGATPLVLIERLRRDMQAFGATDLILQYTPHMLGAWRWGSPATLWLAQAARRAGMNVVLLAHELFLPWRRRPDLALGAALLRAQLGALMKVAHRTLVTMEMRVTELAPLTRLLGLPPPGVVRVGSNALPLTPARQPGTLRLGVFSTLASTKRFDVVLDGFAEVQRRRPEAELVLLGDFGDPADPRVRALRQAVAAHPAAARIHAPGRLDLADVARAVASLDVYLFPMTSGANTRSGTLPLALGTGIPVVAINSYETDSLFVDGENIVFAERLDGAAFARAVLRVVDDQALAARVRAGAKHLYDSHLSWEKIGDQLLSQI